MSSGPWKRQTPRAAAIAAGKAIYWPEKPCRRAHTAERRVRSCRCVTCHNIIAAAWKRSHREALKANDTRPPGGFAARPEVRADA